MANDLQKQEKDLEIERQKSFHQEKMAAIGALSAGIAHEVGNPIAAISALVEEIIQTKIKNVCPYLDGADICKLKMVLENVERLRVITREISGLAEPQSQEFQLLDLNTHIRKTCGLMRYDRRWKNIKIQMGLDKELPAIYGIGDQLTQVIMNLLVNAIDAVEGIEDREPHISIMTVIKNGETCTTVQDNGNGMDENTLCNAKEIFFTTKAVGKGTGLGLSLCHSIITAHQGRIEIESTPDIGTSVHIFLPEHDHCTLEVTCQ